MSMGWFQVRRRSIKLVRSEEPSAPVGLSFEVLNTNFRKPCGIVFPFLLSVPSLYKYTLYAWVRTRLFTSWNMLHLWFLYMAVTWPHKHGWMQRASCLSHHWTAEEAQNLTSQPHVFSQRPHVFSQRHEKPVLKVWFCHSNSLKPAIWAVNAKLKEAIENSK